MKNQVFTGTSTSRRFALCPSSVKAGDPVMFGNNPTTDPLVGVALDDYQSVTKGTTFLLDGTFALTVIGSSSHSPFTGKVINPGDPVFASGTYDAATNITHDLLITGDSSDGLIGHLDPSYVAVGSGLTDTAAEVKINA